jgi:hypothetical protein
MPHFDTPVFEGDVGAALEKAALERAVQSSTRLVYEALSS